MSEEMTPTAELRFLMIYLCLESLGSKFEQGLGAYFEEDELEDIHRLFWFLRDNVVKDIIRGAATGHRLVIEDEKKPSSDASPQGKESPRGKIMGTVLITTELLNDYYLKARDICRGSVDHHGKLVELFMDFASAIMPPGTAVGMMERVDTKDKNKKEE